MPIRHLQNWFPLFAFPQRSGAGCAHSIGGGAGWHAICGGMGGHACSIGGGAGWSAPSAEACGRVRVFHRRRRSGGWHAIFRGMGGCTTDAGLGGHMCPICGGSAPTESTTSLIHCARTSSNFGQRNQRHKNNHARTLDMFHADRLGAMFQHAAMCWTIAVRQATRLHSCCCMHARS